MGDYERFSKQLEGVNDKLKSAHSGYKNKEISWEYYSAVVENTKISQPVKNLEKLVGKRFRRLVKDLTDSEVEFLNFDVKYDGYIRRFDIEIKDLKSNKDKLKPCLCKYLEVANGKNENMDQGVSDFVSNYFIYSITNPNHSC